MQRKCATITINYRVTKIVPHILKWLGAEDLDKCWGSYLTYLGFESVSCQIIPSTTSSGESLEYSSPKPAKTALPTLPHAVARSETNVLQAPPPCVRRMPLRTLARICLKELFERYTFLRTLLERLNED